MAFKFLPLVFHNLGRNKRRTVLTVLSIAASIFVYSALMSLPGVIDQIMGASAGSVRLISSSRGGFMYGLPEAYRARIQQVSHVDAVAGATLYLGIYRQPSDIIKSIALDAGRIEEIWPDWGITHAMAQALRGDRRGCLVDRTLMERFGWRVGDQITLRGNIYPIDLTLNIVAELGSQAPPSLLLLRRDYLDELLGNPGTVNFYWIKVDRPNSIPKVIAEIDETFANSSAETHTESERAYMQNAIVFIRPLLNLMEGFALLVVIAISLVAANTAAMSARERQSELAVMRSIGFTRRLVVVCLIGEGFVMGVAGGVVGMATSWELLKLAPYATKELGPLALTLKVPATVALESMLIAVAVGVLSATIPAIAATRRNIVDQLRAIG